MYKFTEVWFSDSGVAFVHICTCVKEMAKIGISSRFGLPISERARLILTIFSALVETSAIMINLVFVLRSLKGRCYDNQLIIFFWGGEGLFTFEHLHLNSLCCSIPKQNAVLPSA